MRRGEWRKFRCTTLRLLNTSDTGYAWGTQPHVAARRSNREWRQRARRGTATTKTYFVAEAGEAWIGTLGLQIKRTAGGYIGYVSGVWVDPEYRGDRVEDEIPVVDRLVARAEEAARRDSRIHSLVLDVADDNLRARRAYERSGFVAEGPTQHNGPPCTQMVKVLDTARKPLPATKANRPRRTKNHR